MYSFAEFTGELDRIVPSSRSYEEIIDKSAPAMFRLISNKSLLSEEYIKDLLCGKANPTVYLSKNNRFIVQVFVWEGGASTPVHDHHTWGIMGIYRNMLKVTEYELTPFDRPGQYDISETDSFNASAGNVCSVIPPYNEIHQISNPTGNVSVSIHVYGKEIDEYNIYDLENNRIIHKITD